MGVKSQNLGSQGIILSVETLYMPQRFFHGQYNDICAIYNGKIFPTRPSCTICYGKQIKPGLGY